MELWEQRWFCGWSTVRGDVLRIVREDEVDEVGGHLGAQGPGGRQGQRLEGGLGAHRASAVHQQQVTQQIEGLGDSRQRRGSVHVESSMTHTFRRYRVLSDETVGCYQCVGNTEQA